MRGSRAKALRRADPERPNPGRKHGGYSKHLAPKLTEDAWAMRQILNKALDRVLRPGKPKRGRGRR